MKAIKINAPDKCQDKISESIEHLTEISSEFCANDLDHRKILQAYHIRLEEINEILSETEYTGLLDLIKIFIEGVDALVESGRDLNNDECRFLLKFPNLLVEYFSLPLSKLPGKLLVRFFKNPGWVRPISDTEEDVIYHQICQQTDKVESKTMQDMGYTEYAQEILEHDGASDLINEVDHAEIELDIKTEIDITEIIDTEDNAGIEVMPEEPVSLTLTDIDVENEHQSVIDECQSIVAETDNELVEAEDVIEPEQPAEEINLNHLIDSVDTEFPLEENPDDAFDDVVSLGDLLNNIPVNEEHIEQVVTETVSIEDLLSNDLSEAEIINQAEEENPSIELTDLLLSGQSDDADEDISLEYIEASSADAEESCTINENQQLLIDLVRAELAEVLDTRDEDLEALKSEENNEHKQHLLSNYAEQAENISNAVELIGLDGLSKSSKFISENINYLSAMTDEMTDDQFQLLYEWPVKLFAYLQNINDHSSSQDLASFLSWKTWPVAIDQQEADAILTLLNHPVLEEEEKVQRQTIATAEDVSLELPGDVNQELLDGLLQDLPQQTEEFTTAIENLKKSGTKEDIETAQRIAHTLKGAANVVGVRGIASLTHHLEDILEYLNNKNKQPTKTLLEVLVTSSDCLESMSESLLGIDEAPDDAIQVLQSVLEWANILDTDGLPEEEVEPVSSVSDAIDLASFNEDMIEPEPEPVHSSDLSPSNEHDDIKEDIKKSESEHNNTIENILRIPVTLADELLRIAGESLISNTQIEDRIKNTLKRQEALSLHSSTLQQISFDLEHLIDIQGITTNFTSTQDDEDFDALEMDKFHELHSVSRRLVEITSDSMQLSQTLKTELNDLKNLVIDQDKLQKNNQELVLRTRMVPLKSITPRLKRGVRQVCRLTGKSVDLNVIDNDTYIDSEVLNEMIEPLMHVLRNAVDHGIEDAEERLKKNKEATGHININCSRKGDQIVIQVEDDGRGLDRDVIYARAEKKGLTNASQKLTDDAIYRFILEPGFSTRDEVTQTSGRGIGLDVVNNKLRRLKGSINIESPADKGTLIRIFLPISSFSTHSLMVRVRQYIYAISNRGVEEVLYPGSGELRDVGGQLFYHIEGEAYEAKVIDELLNLPPDRRNIERNSRPAIIVRDDAGQRHAILVQSVLDSRDVVVKSMGQYMPKIRGTVGATVLGDGSIAPVVDLPDLLRSGETRTSLVVESHEQLAQPAKRIPYVLVVDDSLSARRSLSQFTEDLGMNTRTARDGIEAAAIISARVPDLVLVDMEMPRMNGLELTAHIRANEKTRDVPVIMITSRSSDKHKATAINKGVNYFIVKPFDEDKLAANINEALADRL